MRLPVPGDRAGFPATGPGISPQKGLGWWAGWEATETSPPRVAGVARGWMPEICPPWSLRFSGLAEMAPVRTGGFSGLDSIGVVAILVKCSSKHMRRGRSVQRPCRQESLEPLGRGKPGV